MLDMKTPGGVEMETWTMTVGEAVSSVKLLGDLVLDSEGTKYQQAW